MRYGRPVSKVDYKLGESKIPLIRTHNYLGIVFDEKLSFWSHIKRQIGRARSELNLLHSVFRHLRVERFVAVYQSLIRNSLLYGSPVWNPIIERQSIALENVQKRALKNLGRVKQVMNVNLTASGYPR